MYARLFGLQVIVKRREIESNTMGEREGDLTLKREVEYGTTGVV